MMKRSHDWITQACVHETELQEEEWPNIPSLESGGNGLRSLSVGEVYWFVCFWVEIYENLWQAKRRAHQRSLVSFTIIVHKVKANTIIYKMRE